MTELIIDIECQSGNAGAEQREAQVETTITGVRWRISGKLAEAIQTKLDDLEAKLQTALSDYDRG